MNGYVKLTVVQHYDDKHYFRCGKCGGEFKTEEAMHQVSYSAMLSVVIR